MLINLACMEHMGIMNGWVSAAPWIGNSHIRGVHICLGSRLVAVPWIYIDPWWMECQLYRHVLYLQNGSICTVSDVSCSCNCGILVGPAASTQPVACKILRQSLYPQIASAPRSAVLWFSDCNEKTRASKTYKRYFKLLKFKVIKHSDLTILIHIYWVYYIYIITIMTIMIMTNIYIYICIILYVNI